MKQDCTNSESSSNSEIFEKKNILFFDMTHERWILGVDFSSSLISLFLEIRPRPLRWIREQDQRLTLNISNKCIFRYFDTSSLSMNESNDIEDLMDGTLDSPCYRPCLATQEFFIFHI